MICVKYIIYLRSDTICQIYKLRYINRGSDEITKVMFQPEKSPYLKYCFECMHADCLPVVLYWKQITVTNLEKINGSSTQHIKTLILQTHSHLFEIKPARS